MTTPLPVKHMHHNSAAWQPILGDCKWHGMLHTKCMCIPAQDSHIGVCCCVTSPQASYRSLEYKLRAGSLPLPAAGGGGGDPAQRTLAEVLDMKAFSTEH